MIRPADPAISGVTMRYMPIGSAEAVRRLAHLAFRDCSTALDLTHAHGRFWAHPLPPGLAVTSNNRDPSSPTDLHLDFRSTGLPNGVFDLVIYDPPHIADGGRTGIMARRFGTVRGIEALRELIQSGGREAWRIASVGILVKVADHAQQGQHRQLTRWVEAAVPVGPYTEIHTIGGFLRDGKHRAVRVPRNNGADRLVFRKDGNRYPDCIRLDERQQGSRIAGPRDARRCIICDGLLGERRRDAVTCSDRCRQQAYRQRGGAACRADQSRPFVS
jgi:hypothetical protein